MALNITKGSVINQTVSDTQPTSPQIGDTWFDTTVGYMKIYDGTSWVATASQDGTIPTTIENRTSDPASPEIGQIWIRTDL